MIEVHAIFKGKVQGVGFRWTVVSYAEKWGVAGHVRNLKDGSVELIAQGSKENLHHFLEAIQHDPDLARIDAIDTEYKQPVKTYTGFHIVH